MLEPTGADITISPAHRSAGAGPTAASLRRVSASAAPSNDHDHHHDTCHRDADRHKRGGATASPYRSLGHDQTGIHLAQNPITIVQELRQLIDRGARHRQLTAQAADQPVAISQPHLNVNRHGYLLLAEVRCPG